MSKLTKQDIFSDGYIAGCDSADKYSRLSATEAFHREKDPPDSIFYKAGFFLGYHTETKDILPKDKRYHQEAIQIKQDHKLV